MEHLTHPFAPSPGLQIPWIWCDRCQRASMVGTSRIVRFTPDALHPHPVTLTLCSYFDCPASTAAHSWRWKTIQLEHPDYPEAPTRNVVYIR